GYWISVDVEDGPPGRCQWAGQAGSAIGERVDEAACAGQGRSAGQARERLDRRRWVIGEQRAGGAAADGDAGADGGRVGVLAGGEATVEVRAGAGTGARAARLRHEPTSSASLSGAPS